MSEAYSAFLREKIKLAPFTGFDVPLEAINPALKPHTREIVRWMAKGGNRACFASFGLHKTATHLELLRQVGQRFPDAFRLGVVPLGVRHEFFREAEQRFTGDCAINLRFIRRDSEIDDPATIYLTNYEAVREGNVTPKLFRATGLDEASILRSYGSKTYQEFLPAFAPVEFKSVFTATPDPNRYKELIHYAAYLGVMDSGQALTRFFQRDSEKAGNLTLYPHKVAEFWMWVASWAVVITKPSDLGHSDDGYILPALDVRWHEIPSDYTMAGNDKMGQGLLIQNTAMSLSSASREKRDSLPARVAKVKALITEAPADHFVVWHDLEDERHALQAAIPEAVSVYGTQDLDEREASIVAFSDGKFPILSTKPIIAGSGCNFQRHCHREIFAGVGHKFNDFIQAIHRVYRFGGSLDVAARIDIIHTEAEREIVASLKAKWARHNEQQERMAALVREYGLDHLAMHETLAKFFTEDSLRRVYDFDHHVDIGTQLQARNALPSDFMSLAPGSHDPMVWHDVVRMRTLNGEQSSRAVEKHVCPLQIDIVDRLIVRYSNPGEKVWDSFHGLGTVGVRAIKLGRTAGGSELNAGYFKDQVHYLTAAEREASMPSLFDVLEEEAVAA